MPKIALARGQSHAECVPTGIEAWLDFTNSVTPYYSYPSFTPLTRTISVRHTFTGIAGTGVTSLGDPNDQFNTIIYEKIVGDQASYKIQTPLRPFKLMVTATSPGVLLRVTSDVTYNLPDLLSEGETINAVNGNLDFEEIWERNTEDSGLQVVILTLIPKLNGETVTVSQALVHFECHRIQDFHFQNVDRITITEVAPLGEPNPQGQTGLLPARYQISAVQ